MVLGGGAVSYHRGNLVPARDKVVGGGDYQSGRLEFVNNPVLQILVFIKRDVALDHTHAVAKPLSEPARTYPPRNLVTSPGKTLKLRAGILWIYPCSTMHTRCCQNKIKNPSLILNTRSHIEGSRPPPFYRKFQLTFKSSSKAGRAANPSYFTSRGCFPKIAGGHAKVADFANHQTRNLTQSQVLSASEKGTTERSLTNFSFKMK